MNILRRYQSSLALPAVCLVVSIAFFASTARGVLVPHFLGVHSFLEAFCIVISLMIFITQFVLRKQSVGRIYSSLGIPYLGIALLDFFHTVSYTGLPDFFTPNDQQKAVSFWVAARLLEAAAFLTYSVGSLNPESKPFRSRSGWVMAGVIGYVALVFTLQIYLPALAPRMVDHSNHLTLLKKGFEYFFVVIHLVISALLMKGDPNGDSQVSRSFIQASLLIAISGLSFSAYGSRLDMLVFLGHLLKALAYFFIFQAALRSELLEPYYQLMKLNNEVRAQAENLRNLHSQLFKLERLSNIGMNVSSIVHDLNNVLGITSLSAHQILNVLAQEEGSGKIEKYSRSIIRSIEKSQQFQKLLLRQARPEAEETALIDVAQSLEELMPLLKLLGGATVEIAIGAESPALLKIPQIELEQLLMNLVVNAKDAFAGRPGEIRIFVMPSDSGTVILSVKDNGPGIALEAREQIFQPFFTTKPVGKGTGLGLYTVKSIVEKNGGTIEVHSQPGHGTEFRMSFRSC